MTFFAASSTFGGVHDFFHSDTWYLARNTGGIVIGVFWLAVGFWANTDELRENWNEAKRWEPEWDDEQREAGYAQWKKAVQRTLDWVDVD